MKVLLCLILLYFDITSGHHDPIVKDLVNKLGNKSSSIREDARLRLFAMEDISVPLLKKFLSETSDPEIIYQLRRLIEAQESFMNVEDLVSIDTLPERYKYPLGVYLIREENERYVSFTKYAPLDLSKVYYKRARDSKVATELLIKDLRRSGWTRYQIMKLLYEMKGNDRVYYYGT